MPNKKIIIKNSDNYLIGICELGDGDSHPDGIEFEWEQSLRDLFDTDQVKFNFYKYENEVVTFDEVAYDNHILKINQNEFIDEMLRLDKQLEYGFITQEEYDTQKAILESEYNI